MGACASLPHVEEGTPSSNTRNKPNHVLAKIESNRKSPTDAQTALIGEDVGAKLESARTGDSAVSYKIRAEGENSREVSL
jgi:hypothetical protein